MVEFVWGRTAVLALQKEALRNARGGRIPFIGNKNEPILVYDDLVLTLRGFQFPNLSLQYDQINVDMKEPITEIKSIFFNENFRLQ